MKTLLLSGLAVGIGVTAVTYTFFTHSYTREAIRQIDSGTTGIMPIEDCTCLGKLLTMDSFPAQYDCQGVEMCSPTDDATITPIGPQDTTVPAATRSTEVQTTPVNTQSGTEHQYTRYEVGTTADGSRGPVPKENCSCTGELDIMDSFPAQYKCNGVESCTPVN